MTPSMDNLHSQRFIQGEGALGSPLLRAWLKNAINDSSPHCGRSNPCNGMVGHTGCVDGDSWCLLLPDSDEHNLKTPTYRKREGGERKGEQKTERGRKGCGRGM